MSGLSTSHLGRGFAEPVLDAQRSFRVLLAAMSEPGTLHMMSSDIEPPVGLVPAAAIALLTLADQDTPVWLAPAITAASGYVRFHCGAPMAEAPGTARFAVIDGALTEPSLSAFDPGLDRYPDQAATVIVQCARLTGGAKVCLRGPGIRDTRTIAPDGLRAGFWQEVAANNARHPLGVDLILIAGTNLMALPRSTEVQPREGG